MHFAVLSYSKLAVPRLAPISYASLCSAMLNDAQIYKLIIDRAELRLAMISESKLQYLAMLRNCSLPVAMLTYA